MRDHLTRFRTLTTDRWGGGAVVGLAVAAVGVVTIVLALRPPAPSGAAASAAAPATTGIGSTASLTARPTTPGTASVRPSAPRTSNPPTETQTTPQIPGSSDPSSSVRSSAPSPGAPDPQQVAARWLQLVCTWTHTGNNQDNLQHARTLMTAGAEIGQNWRINAGDWGDLQSRHVDSRCTRITTRVDVGNPSVDGRTTIVVAMTADQIFSSAGNDFQRIAITETRELHRAGNSWLVGRTAGTA